MPRTRRTPVPFTEGDIQHHIVTCLPARVVAQLEIRQSGKKIGVAGPGITREDLEHTIYQKFGRGKFEITALDYEGHPLEGFELVDGKEPPRSSDLVGLAQAAATSAPVVGADVIEAAADLVANERVNIQQQIKAMDTLRISEEESRRKGATDFVGLVKAQASEQTKMLESVLKGIREEASANELARNRFLQESVQAERARAQTLLADAKSQQALRDETWQNQVALERERAAMMVEGNDSKWKSAIDQIQAAFTSQIETIKAQNAMEIARLKDEADKASDLMRFQGDSVPKDVVREIMLRKLDIEMPEPSSLDNFKEKFFDPALEILERVLPVLLPQLKNLLPMTPEEPVQSNQLSPAAGAPVATPSPAGAPAVTDSGDFTEGS